MSEQNPSILMFALKRAPCGWAFQTNEAMNDHRLAHGCGRRNKKGAF